MSIKPSKLITSEGPLARSPAQHHNSVARWLGPMLPMLLTMTTMLLLILASHGVLAAEQCIQHPKRVQPCPHLIYRAMQLKADQPMAITCICLTDFAKFLVPPTTDKDKIMRKMELSQLAIDLGLTEAQVASLAKR